MATSINSFANGVRSARICRSQFFEHKATSSKKQGRRTSLPIFPRAFAKDCQISTGGKLYSPMERWPQAGEA